jgi:hypothetical protein
MFATLAGCAMLVAGCGGAATSFPEEAECPAPSPLPTVRNQPGVVSFGSYLTRIRSSADTLSRLRADLRAKYPDDTFYRRDEFRPDFAAYADQTVCVAEAMQSLTAPNSRFVETDDKLDAALGALIEHTRAGREAVRARNVSDYRKWYSAADAKIEAVRNLAFGQP